MRLSRLAVAPMVAGALSFAACDGNVTVNPPSVTATITIPAPTETTEPPTIEPTDSPSPTGTLVPLPPTSPEFVAFGLYQAWGLGNRDLALSYAESETVVDDLFANEFIPGAFISPPCPVEGDVGHRCELNAEANTIVFHILGNAANGYRVTSVEITSAG